MKTYTAKVSGMTCNGCRMLTTEALKEEGFEAVEVDLLKQEARFGSVHESSNVLESFASISKEYPKFSFSDLKEI